MLVECIYCVDFLRSVCVWYLSRVSGYNMGITWRSAMPLLSTLAALVIIVHSAEENLDREHRYELRPRFLDTRSAENEQVSINNIVI